MFAPFYKLEIANAGKKDDITELVKSFVYEDCIEEDSLLKIVIDSSAAMNLADDSRFVTGSVITFQFGYIQGKISPVHTARITDITHDYGASVSMTITCLDLGNVIKKASSTKIWKGKTSSQIAEEIAASWGLQSSVQKTTKVWDDLPQGNKDDKELLKYLAEREEGGDYHTYIRNNTLYFEKRDLQKASSFTYTYGEDIVKFRPSMKESSISPDAIKAKATVTDPFKSISASISANSKTEKDSGGYTGKYKTVYNGSGTAIGRVAVNQDAKQEKATGKGFGKPTMTASPDKKEAENLTNAKKKKATLKTLVADLTVNGNPLIVPTDIITVSNVAKRHSGNWFITKVTHNVTNGGYTTNVGLSKNAVRDKNANKVEAPKGAVNNSIGEKPQNKKSTVAVKGHRYDENGNRL